MIRFAMTLVVFLIGQAAVAQDTSPLSVVQRQLDTYNAQDLEGFTAVFAEEAEIYSRIGDAKPSVVGREAIRDTYGKIFRDHPNNQSTLLGRMVQGNFVFDHEWITGRGDGFKLMAIYEVRDGLIVRAWFVR